MGIFSRLADIVNANIGSILDRAEDPEKMVRLMIQEMEDTLVEVRASAARVIAERKNMERQLRHAREAQAEWQRKAELAVSKGREDLAKGALRERTKLADTEAHITDELALLKDAYEKHTEDVAKLEAKLRETKAKQKSIVTRHDSAAARLEARRRLHDYRIEDAFARFETLERRIDETEGRAEAFDLGEGKSLAEEIRDLEADSEIEEELEALKARLAGEEPAPKAKN